MLTEQDKEICRRSSGRIIANDIYRGIAENIVSCLSHFFLDEEIKGLENLPTSSAVYTSTHTTFFDPIKISHILRRLGKEPHALVDSEAFSRLRFIFGNLEQVPFDIELQKPEARRNYAWSLEQISNYIDKREDLLIFNDGPTQKEKYPLPIAERPNSAIPAKIALVKNVPLVPVYCSIPKKYLPEIYTWGNSGWEYIFSNRRMPYRVSFLEPLYPKDFNSVKEMKIEVRKRQIEAEKILGQNI